MHVGNDETLIGNDQNGIETTRDFLVSDVEMEQSFFTIGDDDDHLPKHLSKYQR